MTGQDSTAKRTAGPGPGGPAAPPEMDRLAPLAPNAWLRYDVIRRMLPAGVGDVLEIGCGQGAVGVRLAERYAYLGLEPDPQSFAMAEQRIALGGRGEVRNALVESLDPDERFDLVCAFEVLDHIEDAEGALKEWAARLRPHGWLLLSVPAHQKRYAPFDELVGHFRRYDQEPMSALLTRVGFTDIAMREYGMPLGFVLEAGRNQVGKRRLAATPAGEASMEERTTGSGRLLQPRSALQGKVIRWGTAPFRYAQRGFPRTGTGMVVRARLAD
jgi:SAM-dependent methyltransferase